MSPGNFGDVSDLLAPELRRRVLLDDPVQPDAPSLTYRERRYGQSQKGLRSDHVGFRYKYDTYEQTIAEEHEAKAMGPLSK